MVKKLRIRLIVILMVSLFAIAAMILSLMMLIMRARFITEEDKILKNVAANENLNKVFIYDYEMTEESEITYDDKSLNPVIGTFFVKTDYDGSILKVSSNIFDRIEHLQYLIKKVQNKKNNHGEIRLVELNLAYYFLEKEDGIIYVFTDISERKRILIHTAYVFLSFWGISFVIYFVFSLYFSKRATKPIEASIKRQDKFVADASHELRTPISVIRTNVELVMDSPDETVADNMKWLKNIQSEAIRLAKMTESLLSLVKSNSIDDTDLKTEKINIKELVLETYESFIPLMREKNLESEFICDDENIYINANYELLRKLTSIFIDNAIKYTNAGKITITAGKSDNIIDIKIKDTGIGINKTEQEKIFERFYRSDKARTKNGGFGLGLNIAKNIIDDYKGKIIINSEPGKGSEFIIRLPS